MRTLTLLVLLAILSGCASRSYEGTDMGDAVGSGYWGSIAGIVHDHMQ